MPKTRTQILLTPPALRLLQMLADETTTGNKSLWVEQQVQSVAKRRGIVDKSSRIQRVPITPDNDS